MEYPNKIYVCEFKGSNNFSGESHFVIVIAASDIDTAKQYVKEKIGFDSEPIWLMGAVYPTIYVQNGSKPERVQAKILSNNNFHTYKKEYGTKST